LDKGLVKGMAHITGGGFLDNIPRVLPDNCNVEIKLGSWPVLPVFELMQKKGKVPQDDMYRTFNMGIGFVLIVAKRDVQKVINAIKGVKAGANGHAPRAYVIGQVVKGKKKVELI
jgi:phosphoribosylformylglycinamidine cyclo-ligase